MSAAWYGLSGDCHRHRQGKGGRSTPTGCKEVSRCLSSCAGFFLPNYTMAWESGVTGDMQHGLPGSRLLPQPSLPTLTNPRGFPNHGVPLGCQRVRLANCCRCAVSLVCVPQVQGSWRCLRGLQGPLCCCVPCAPIAESVLLSCVPRVHGVWHCVQGLQGQL